jgi:hypothetical protein
VVFILENKVLSDTAQLADRVYRLQLKISLKPAAKCDTLSSRGLPGV